MDLGPIHMEVHITGPEVPSSWGLGSSLHPPPDHIGYYSTARFTLHYLPLLLLSTLSPSSASSSSTSSSLLPLVDQAPCYLHLFIPSSRGSKSQYKYPAVLCSALIWPPLPRHSSTYPLHPELRANPAHPLYTNPCCIESAV